MSRSIPVTCHRGTVPVLLALGGLLAALLVAAPAAAESAVAGPRTTGGVAKAGGPAIYPVPQRVQRGTAVRLGGRIVLVTGSKPDRPALASLRHVLRSAGSTVVRAPAGARLPRRSTVVYLGTPADNPAIRPVLQRIGVPGGPALRQPEGYVIGAGHAHGHRALVLAGRDGSGTFYAVQTLRQLVRHGRVAPVTVHDWPLMPIRGVVEGFYGFPWSHRARLDQLAFYGRQKMNTYIYSPKDDPLLRARWRELYTGEQLSLLQELVDTATANHVEFTYALSPGNDICYSSPADHDATIRKFQSLYDLGVRSFYIALDDIPLRLTCQSDKDMFTKGNWGWLADAQAYYLNAIDADFVQTHAGLRPLQMVPTNYAGSAPDPYKAELGEVMDSDILVQWTGEEVVSHRITTASATQARTTYGTAADPRELFIWDNYPVNDFAQDRLFLAPLIGRDADLYTAILGITSNPMIEPYASLPVLSNYADFTWNPPAYRPEQSMAAALRLLAGPRPRVREALFTFADLNQDWQDDPLTPNAPRLSADVEAFWSAYAAGGTDRALARRLQVIAALPRTLSRMAERGFYTDTRHWAVAASRWARALQHAQAMLAAVRSDHGARAIAEHAAMHRAVTAATRPTQPTLDQGTKTPKVGDGVFEEFVENADDVLADWLGLAPSVLAAEPTTTMGTYSSYAPANLVDGDPATLYWTDAAPVVGDAIGVDLGTPQQVSSVRIQQSDSDSTAGDMLYHARLQYSADGTTWTDAGTYDDTVVIEKSFSPAVRARYVRLVATGENPGGNWVKIREFTVAAEAATVRTTIPTASGSAAAYAADGDVETTWTAARRSRRSDRLEVTSVAPTNRWVTVVGTARARVQARHDGSWTDLGRLRATGFTRLGLPGQTRGLRLRFLSGPQPEITEIVLN